jgi:hypothetical protein
MPNAECRMPNAECRMPNAECRMPNAECRMPNAECRMPNAERILHMEDRRTGGEARIPSIIIKRSSIFMPSRYLNNQLDPSGSPVLHVNSSPFADSQQPTANSPPPTTKENAHHNNIQKLRRSSVCLLICAPLRNEDFLF